MTEHCAAVVADEIVSRASRLLNVDVSHLRPNCSLLGDGLVLAVHPERSFGAIIIDSAGGVLFGAAGVSPQKLAEQFRAGRRTDVEVFRFAPASVYSTPAGC